MTLREKIEQNRLRVTTQAIEASHDPEQLNKPVVQLSDRDAPNQEPHISQLAATKAIQAEALELFAKLTSKQAPREATLQINEINTDALKKDIECQNIRDFFNLSYSSKDKNNILAESDAKHRHPHEWRSDTLKKNNFDTNHFNDYSFKTIEYSAARSMSLSHKEEMNSCARSQVPRLQAQHQAEISLFDFQSVKFERPSVKALQEAHIKALDHYANFKAVTTKKTIEERPEMGMEFQKGNKLDYKAPLPKASMAYHY